MTEKIRPAKRGGLAWEKARRLLPQQTSALDNWPESFTPDELAGLQYPREGTDPEQRKARSNQAAMIRALKARIEQCEIETAQREITVPIYKAVDAFRVKIHPMPGERVRVKVGEETKGVQTITRLGFRLFLEGEGETASEHIRDWLGDILQATAPEQGGKDDEIPGKLPPVASGQLAIKAAWQIECETGSRASDKEVMTRLQDWADNGKESAILRKSIPEKRAVQWVTTKGKEKDYDLEACQKALEKWFKSRP